MTVLYIFIGIIVLLLIIAALLPGRYHVEQSTIINKSVEEVMDKVANLNYYSKWNPWQIKESNGKVRISGEPKTIGHSYTWQGRRVGTGRLTIRAIDDRHIYFDLLFIKPWKSEAKDYWFFEDWGTAETKVTWQNNGDLPFPVHRLIGQMIHKNLDKEFMQGLKNLKRLCEE